MNKALESIEVGIQIGISEGYLTEDSINDVETIRKALHVPTIDEIVELLVLEFGVEDIFYRTKTNEFIRNWLGLEEELVWLNREGEIETIKPLRPVVMKELSTFFLNQSEVE